MNTKTLTGTILFTLALTSMSVAQDFNVYLTGQVDGTEVVSIFDSGGDYLSGIASGASFRDGINFDGSNLLIVEAPRGNGPNRLLNVSLDGNLNSTASLSFENLFSDINSQGNLYAVTTDASASILVYGGDGHVSLTIDAGSARGADGDANGNIFASSLGGTVTKYDASGNFLTSSSFPGNFPGDVAIDETNEVLYVASQSGGIVTYDISGDSIVETGSFATVGNPLDLKYDEFSQSLFYVTDAGGIQADAEGTVLEVYTTAGLAFPWAIEVVPVPEPTIPALLLPIALLFGLRRRN